MKYDKKSTRHVVEQLKLFNVAAPEFEDPNAPPPVTSWAEIDPAKCAEDLTFRLWEVRQLRETLAAEHRAKPQDATREALLRCLDLEHRTDAALASAKESLRVGWVSGRHFNSEGLSLNQILDLHAADTAKVHRDSSP